MHNLHSPSLFETRYGSVLRCACCGRIQITFRDYTLLVDADRLESLIRTVRSALDEVQAGDGPDQWRLEAGTDAGRVSLLLPKPALRAVHDLLKGGWEMYTLQQRVRAVASGTEGSARTVLRDHVPRPR